MNLNWKELLGSKTFWTALASIGGAVVSAANHAITWPQAAQLVLTAVSALFIKDAIVTAAKGN